MKKRIKRKNDKVFVKYVFTVFEYVVIGVIFALLFLLRHFLEG